MPEEKEKLRKVVGNAKSRVSDRLVDLWWWFLIRGLLAIALAVVALFWPQKTIGILVNLLGAYLLIDGVLGAIGAIRSGGKNGFPVFAIVSFVVGAILLFWTGISVRVFLVLVGLWALIQGGSLFLSSRNNESDAESRQLIGILGALLAAAGLVLVVWPVTGVVTISWLIAVVALAIGCLLIFVATRLRQISQRLKVSDRIVE